MKPKLIKSQEEWQAHKDSLSKLDHRHHNEPKPNPSNPKMYPPFPFLVLTYRDEDSCRGTHYYHNFIYVKVDECPCGDGRTVEIWDVENMNFRFPRS